jgi:hypothetical protein
MSKATDTNLWGRHAGKSSGTCGAGCSGGGGRSDTLGFIPLRRRKCL